MTRPTAPMPHRPSEAFTLPAAAPPRATRRARLLCASGVAVAMTLLGAAEASAAPIKLDQADRAVVLDGVPNPGEWPREPQRLDAIGAPASPSDLSARAVVAYDAKQLYVAVDVTDEVFRAGDRVELALEIAGQLQTLTFTPGEPGKSAGKVTLAGRPVAGAKAVEAPKKGGWTLEASVPWSAIPGASSNRVGLRGALTVHDADKSGSVESVVGWGHAGGLQPVWTTPEQALAEGLVREKRLGAPSHAVTANVVGDGLLERVLVIDRYLVVLGPNFRGGTQYYFRDLSVPDKNVTVTRLEARDLDGDGRDELVLNKRLMATKPPAPGKSRPFRDHVEVLSFGTSDVPNVLLLAETAVGGEKGAITNPIRISMEGRKGVITIGPATAHQTDAASFNEPVERTLDPAPTPWGRVESRTYKLRATGFVVDSEKTRAEPAPAPVGTAPSTKPAPAPAAPPAVDASKVYEQYKRDRSVRGTATATLTGNFSGDGRPERVALHDRDLVVWGPGFKGGTAYAYTTLGFAKGSDIVKLSAVDVTGDGLAEIVVRGVLRNQHGADEVAREVELVFVVAEQGLRRIFGAELARSIGGKRVEGAALYGRGKITLSSGRAVGFTKASYPFAQDTGPVGGLEPLLLPWSPTTKVEYLHKAGAFERR